MTFDIRSLRAATTLLAFTALAACSSAKHDDPTPALGMSWTADGTNETANIITHSVGGNILFLDGYAGDTATSFHWVSLWLPKTVAVGTYSLTANAAGSYSTIANRTGIAYVGRTGSITVTSLTATNIKGTFSFAETPINPQSAIKTITNGTFNVDL
jgi:prepilin-type processing-associated H-X9-DG protein